MSMRVNYYGKSFAQWLLEERKTAGDVGKLAEVARSDPRFPKQADIDDVRKHLRKIPGAGDFLGAVTAAEGLWLRC